MKILITGGAGFIGSHLTDHLLKENNQVLVIDNYSTGRRENLPSHPQLQIIEGSISDELLLRKLFSDFKPDTVIHCAAAYKDPNAWEEDVHTNVLGSIHIARCCKEHNIKRLIYFQTALCYGLMPQEQPITLHHPIIPKGSSYAYSKTTAEQYIELSGVPYITFRLANVYGPRNLSGPLPTFFQRLSTNKSCWVMDTRRDFLFIDDLVEVVLKAVNGHGETGAYHISSGSDVSIKELFDAVLEGMKIKLDQDIEVRPRPEDDAPSILLDPSKTNIDFNWKTKWALKDGVKKAIAWYQENSIEETYTHLKPVKS